MITAAPMGDPNASIPTPQPVHYRPMFGAYGAACSATSVLFVSEASKPVVDAYGLGKETLAVRDCRSVRKADMRLNDYCPEVEVDPETYEVRVDGSHISCEPATELPLAQRYFLF